MIEGHLSSFRLKAYQSVLYSCISSFPRGVNLRTRLEVVACFLHTSSCLLTLSCCRNERWHLEHWNGFESVWIRTCRLRALDVLRTFSQMWHLYLSSLDPWVRSCFIKLLFELNAFEQWLHLNWRRFLWVSICRFYPGFIYVLHDIELSLYKGGTSSRCCFGPESRRPSGRGTPLYLIGDNNLFLEIIATGITFVTFITNITSSMFFI